MVGNVWSILPLLCQLKYCALISKQKLASGIYCCYLRQALCSLSWSQIFDPASASQVLGLLCLVSNVSSSKLVGLKWGKGGCLCMRTELMIWLGTQNWPSRPDASSKEWRECCGGNQHFTIGFE